MFRWMKCTFVTLWNKFLTNEGLLLRCLNKMKCYTRIIINMILNMSMYRFELKWFNSSKRISNYQNYVLHICIYKKGTNLWWTISTNFTLIFEEVGKKKRKF